MSVLSKVERIDREIFKAGMFSVKSTILTGKKNNSTNAKLDAVYNRTYASQKYSNQSELTVVNISTSDFLVFAYNNYDVNNKANEEIFISHPNMMDIKWFCNELLTMITSNDIFNQNNSVNVKYKDHQLNSPSLGGNKVLVAIPASIQKDQNAVRGVYLFFNSEDKYVELDSRAIFTLNEIIRNIDLLTLSNATLMLGMMANINTLSEEDTYSPAPKNSLPPRGNFFSGKGNNRFQPRNEAPQPQQPNTPPVEETNNAFAPQPQQPNTPQPNTPAGGSRFKRPGASNTNTNNGGGLPNRSGLGTAPQENPVVSGEDVLNMNNILNTASGINFEPSGEEDIDF